MASKTHDLVGQLRRQLHASVAARESARRMALALEALDERNDVIANETDAMWLLYEEFVAEIAHTLERAEAEGCEL